jgi:hypothetical protein
LVIENINLPTVLLPLSFSPAITVRPDNSISASLITQKLFTDLQEIIGRDYDKDSAIKRAFGKVIYSEFRGVISRNKTVSTFTKNE